MALIAFSALSSKPSPASDSALRHSRSIEALSQKPITARVPLCKMALSNSLLVWRAAACTAICACTEPRYQSTYDMCRYTALTSPSRFTADRDSSRITVEPSNMSLDPLEGEMLVVKPKIALFNGDVIRILLVSLIWGHSHFRSKKAEGPKAIAVMYQRRSHGSLNSHFIETATIGLPRRIDSATSFAGSLGQLENVKERQKSTPDRIRPSTNTQGSADNQQILLASLSRLVHAHPCIHTNTGSRSASHRIGQ
jgi:hypothetical protein